MSIERHDIQWENVAPYLLGALVDVEERAFESHLDECHVCRDEVERLRPAVDALPRSVEPMEAPPTLKASLMQAVEADVARARRVARGQACSRACASAPRSRRQRWQARGPARHWPRRRWCWSWARHSASRPPRPSSSKSSQTLSAQRRQGADSLRRRQPRDSRGQGRRCGAARDRHARADPRPHLPGVGPARRLDVPQDSLFTVGEDGQGSAVVTDDLTGADAVAVTRERAGGARAPGEDPILTVEL